MAVLYQRLAVITTAWRAQGYPAPAFSALAEILAYQREAASGQLRYLRPPQLRALETDSDVPERKDDLVAGVYELPAPEGKTTVAVKIVDMLGEEVLVTRSV